MNMKRQLFPVDILGRTLYALHKLYLDNSQWLKAKVGFR